MVSSGSRRRKGVITGTRLYSGKFHCVCGHKWAKNDVKYDIPEECVRCGRDVLPRDLKLVSPVDTNGFIAEENVKYFGQFQCYKCLKTWFSAHSWYGFAQQCKRCSLAVYPHKLRQLTKSEGMNRKNDPNRGHEKDLCSKCKQLGRYCGKSGKKYRK